MSETEAAPRTAADNARSFAALWLGTVVLGLIAVDWSSGQLPSTGWRFIALMVAGVLQLIAYGWLIASFGAAWIGRKAQPRVFRTTCAWVGGVALGVIALAVGPTLWLMTQPTEIDTAGIEADVEDWLRDNGIEATADCPATMVAEQGTTNDCVVTAADDGSTAVVEIRWQNDDGEYVMQFAQ